MYVPLHILYFFTMDGEEISRIPGYIPADEFLVKLRDVIENKNLNQSS